MGQSSKVVFTMCGGGGGGDEVADCSDQNIVGD